MRRLQDLVQSAILPAICFAAVAYFAYYAIYGQFGYGELVQTRAALTVEEGRLARLDAENARLARRARLLASAHVDPDYLDERLRALAGYARPGDIIVMRPEDGPRPGAISDKTQTRGDR